MDNRYIIEPLNNREQMKKIMDHYNQRYDIHQQLQKLLTKRNDENSFCELALGISNPYGNFSANRHSLGYKILKNNGKNIFKSIFNLANELNCIGLKPKEISNIISDANISYLKISIGTELSTMLQPNLYWVANIRTIWCYLLFEYNGDLSIANEAFTLYKDDERESKADYKLWAGIYLIMEENLRAIGDVSIDIFKEAGIVIGSEKYLWIDVICSELYAIHHRG